MSNEPVRRFSMDALRSQRFSSVASSRTTDEPPPYVRRHTLAQLAAPREPTEHVYHLKDNSRHWVTLKLYSSAKSSKSLPLYFEREDLNGSLEVNAERGDSIHSVTAKVVGRIITGVHPGDTFIFLSQSIPIWAKSADVPRMSSPSEGASGNKLLGCCEWPLSIALPGAVTIPSVADSTLTYRLPETFSERHINASVQYDFTIVVGRGRFRSDRQVKTAFGYVPRTKPEQPSLLRQVAYREFSPLPGPESDPEGWKTLMPVFSRGVLFPNHPVDVRCFVSLAKPLCYTRGTLIPCALKLESLDKNVLDIFATPAAIGMHLRRRVKFFSTPSGLRKPEHAAWNECVEDMGTAIWWPSPNLGHDASSRYLDGEIKLARALKPTSAIGHFSISYAVVLRPFKVPYFSSDSQDLLSEEVEIATMHADGPRPHAYSDGPAHNPIAQRSDEYYAATEMSPLSTLQGYIN